MWKTINKRVAHRNAEKGGWVTEASRPQHPETTTLSWCMPSSPACINERYVPCVMTAIMTTTYDMVDNDDFTKVMNGRGTHTSFTWIYHFVLKQKEKLKKIGYSHWHPFFLVFFSFFLIKNIMLERKPMRLWIRNHSRKFSFHSDSCVTPQATASQHHFVNYFMPHSRSHWWNACKVYGFHTVIGSLGCAVVCTHETVVSETADTNRYDVGWRGVGG